MYAVAKMEAYYRLRASEYDTVYGNPVWQRDLDRIRRAIANVSTGKKLLDLACGTGYWMVHASQHARSILAVDINDSVLDVARTKAYGCPSLFHRADLYAFRSERQYSAAMLGFWLSHLDQNRAGAFQETVLASLKRGARILAFDEIIRGDRGVHTEVTDHEGNRWEARRLKDGQEFQIIKNAIDTDWFPNNLPGLELRTFDLLDHTWIAHLSIPR